MTAPHPDPLRWKALAVVCAAFFMTVLDVSIVNVALPSIGKGLHFAQDDLQWVITAYAITFGGFLMLGGRAADLLGRRRVFVAGVVVFTIASFFCGLAWSEGVLIASRAVQGLGAAIISPAALAIIMTTFDEGAERNKALGIWGAIGGGGAAVGVLAGGVLTKYLGWEWIFFVNVPVGAIALGLTPRFVRESRAERESSPDVLGAVAVTSGLALLVYAVSTAPAHHWGSAKTLLLLAASVALLAAFLVIEARTKDPLMPFHIFRIRTVSGANISALLLGASLFANFFLLTLYVQEVLGWSALKTGLTFIATAGSAVLWAGVAQALVTRFGAKPIMVIGFVGMLAGMLWYTTIPVHGSYWGDLLPGYLIIGFAIPFAFIPVSIAALAGIEHHEAGLASGIFNTAQQIGGAIGVAMVSSVSISRFNHLVPTKGFAQAFTSGTRYGFWACVVVSVIGLLAVLALVRRDELAHVDEAEAAALG
ncbi:MAG TPA: MFS transporter [Gaiellaceae bacterium]|nr:MFS transporter [Gaiellaceae bacterium]